MRLLQFDTPSDLAYGFKCVPPAKTALIPYYHYVKWRVTCLSAPLPFGIA